MASAGLGFLLLLLAAVSGGLYTTPLGIAKTGWSFEAKWFLYSLLADIVFPWTVALATVTDLLGTFRRAPGGKIALTAFFGFLWGIGCQLFGLGVSMVGNSLAFALILGLSATLGSVIPLVALHPDEVGSQAGLLNFAGLGLAVAALVLTAVAGRLKERDAAAVAAAGRLTAGSEAATDASPSGEATSFSRGVVVCVLSGIFSGCLNLATSFGQEISEAAVAAGTPRSMSTNAIYAISIAAGGIPSLVWCGYAMFARGERLCSHSRRSWVKNLVTTSTMGVLWFGSNVAYGVATTELPGNLGTVLGWPIYIIGMVVVANVSGVLAGEWRLGSPKAKAWMGAGLVVLCLAIVAVGLAGVA